MNKNKYIKVLFTTQKYDKIHKLWNIILKNPIISFKYVDLNNNDINLNNLKENKKKK